MKDRVADTLRRVQVGTRILLASTMLGSTACATARAEVKPKPDCPRNAFEVSYLVGGHPKDWKKIEGADDENVGYEFKSETPQGIYASEVGRVTSKEQGRILTYTKTDTAWYICIKRDNNPTNNPQNPS